VLAKLLAQKVDRAPHAALALRCILTGTQPLTAALYRKVRDRFGPIVRITYGKAECFNPVTVLPPPAVEACLIAAGPDTSPQQGAASCVGWAAPGVEIEVRPAEDAPDDQHSGEVWIRARHMSNGMLGPDGYKPHEPDGWHRSGDLGYLDDEGRLILTGRVADVIKTGGYRVNPQEIEAALASAGLADALCVSSVPSEYWGEIIIAIAENPPADWERRAAEQMARLSRHKRPRAYLAIDQLPRNAQGKIQRKAASRLVLTSHRLLDGPYPELVPRDEGTHVPEVPASD
jgi:acyl-CoA synthetase (AMP-forming)/AMP-acid ligase II